MDLNYARNPILFIVVFFGIYGLACASMVKWPKDNSRPVRPSLVLLCEPVIAAVARRVCLSCGVFLLVPSAMRGMNIMLTMERITFVW